MNRNCPSLNSVMRRKVSRHTAGSRKGSAPSSTSIRAKAANKVSLMPQPVRLTGEPGDRESTRDHLPPVLPPDLKYLKNSEFGSSTSTSFLFLKLARYASRLR